MGHVVESNKFDREIDKRYGILADSPGLPTEKSVESVMGLPSLDKWSEYKFSLDIDAENMYRPNDPKNAEAITQLGSDNRSSTVTLYRSSFASFRNLAHNMMHEMGHVIYNRLGFMQLTNKLYDSNTAIYGSERYAYKFAAKYGGLPYENNLDYARGVGYTNGLPLKNFGNGWYINY